MKPSSLLALLVIAVPGAIAGVNDEFQVPLSGFGSDGNTTLLRGVISGGKTSHVATITLTDSSGQAGPDGVYSGMDLDLVVLDRDGDFTTKRDQVRPDLSTVKFIPGVVRNSRTSTYQPTAFRPGILLGLGRNQSTVDHSIATLTTRDGSYDGAFSVNVSHGWLSLGDGGRITVSFPPFKLGDAGVVYLFAGDVGSRPDAVTASVVLSTPRLPSLPYTTYRIQPVSPTVKLGESVGAIGDVTGDGVPDFAVSGSQSIFGSIRGGIVRVYSGRDGRALYTIESSFTGEGYALNRNLVGLGDLDGDGIGEIGVGSPPGTNLDPAGFFEIFRGNDGTLLRTHSGTGNDQLGYEIAALGDSDGDGVPDYAASSFELGNEGGRVRIYSGSGGEEIAQVTSNEMLRFYSIAGPGDLDGDGRGELAVTLWSEFDPWKVGEIRVFSGALFGAPDDPAGSLDVFAEPVRAETVLELKGRTDLPGGFESIGLGLNALGDINGDGVPDLGAGTGPTSDAVIFSGADGTRLREVFSGQFDLIWQTVVETEGIGDLDGDGVRDFVVGLTGVIRVISGKDGSVLAVRNGDGKLGEEIAAIGDLDGDGISEILAGAPEGGYAELISFSLERTFVPDTPSGFAVRRQGNRTIASWRSGLEDAVLELSTDLVNWQPVDDLMFENLYVVPPGAPEELFYRLRFEP